MAQNLSPVSWQQVFLHNIPSNPTLPSGAPITIHPVLNTEPNAIDSGWIRNGVDATGEEWLNQEVVVGGDVALRTYVMNANDAAGSGIRNDGFPFLITAAGEARVIGASFFGGYVRFVTENISGSTLTQVNISSKGGTATPAGLTISADQAVFDQSPTTLTKAVTVGRQPDGDYVNSPADGNVYSHGTPLGAAGTFTTDVFDTDGWKAIELYVATDQVSLGDGIVIEYTDDAQAVSPNWYPGPTFTYGADAVAAGFFIKRFAPALDGFRLTYTNGGTPQGSWYLSLELKNGVTEPTSISLENDIDPAISALLGRSVDAAVNDLGTYGNITRSDLGGKRVSILEHEAETPLEALNNLSGNATSVGSGSATQIASAPPVGTRTVTIQADPDNTKIVYIGFNNSVTSGNSGCALAAGDFITFEVDDTPEFYAISGAGSQTVRWIYAARI